VKGDISIFRMSSFRDFEKVNLMITDYSFGRMVIGEKEYTSDVIIYPDGRIRSSWWRKSGHVLEIADIEDLISELPEVIVAGTGAYGVMKPSRELIDDLRQKQIEFKALPTGEAVSAYNEMADKKKAGGCFHLTC
jgi:hypothetical protein